MKNDTFISQYEILMHNIVIRLPSNFDPVCSKVLYLQHGTRFISLVCPFLRDGVPPVSRIPEEAKLVSSKRVERNENKERD